MLVNTMRRVKRLVDPDALLLQGAADPSRLAILRQLAASPAVADGICACDFTSCCDVAQPTVSHHLKVLRDAGVVTTRRKGTYIYYRLSPDFTRRWSSLSASLAGLVAIA